MADLAKTGVPLHAKHDSWPNMAEIELSVLGRIMKNYIPEIQLFYQEAQALTDDRIGSNASADWQFPDDARIKLNQLYPSISS